MQKHGFAFAKIYTHDYYRGYYDSRIHDEPYALTDTIPLTALNNEIKLVRKDEVNILSVALLDEDDFTYWIDNGYCKITKDGDVYDVVIEGDLVKRNKEKGVHIEAMAPSVVVCGRICGSYRGAGHVK